MSLINQDRLKKYLDLGYNVLFEGEHGVGKTAVIKQVFENKGFNWMYMSASTLDPWVDFVGVPKIVDKDGVSSLKIIRPDYIANDEVDAIFFDELNRAPDKVINAIMELIQFRSINGHKLKRLKVIWAAINPEDDDDTYSVNHLDPAHLDRFHVKINVPFKIDKDYFLGKYPTTGPSFIDWWEGLPIDIRKTVSPRRLDYAADAYNNDCRLEDFLPKQTNVSKLRTLLQSVPFQESIKNIHDIASAETFLKDINNATKLLDLVKSKDTSSIEFFTKFGRVLPAELSAPVAEYVYAHQKGLSVIKSFEELISMLPDDNGDQGTAAIINNVELELLYKNGGSIENDLRALILQKRNLVRKLANRLCDILVKCKHPTVTRIMWGLGGRAENRPTNFQTITNILNKIDSSFFTHKQKTYINKKLYENKIVDSMYWL